MKRGASHHPKMYALAEELGIPLPCAVGVMHMLWEFTADRRPQGDIGSLPDKEIAQAVGWSKRPKILIDALCSEKCRWLDRDDTHRLVVHDWPDHAESWVCRKLVRCGKDFIAVYGKNAKLRVEKSALFTANKPIFQNSGTPTRKAMAMASEELKSGTRAGEDSELDLEDAGPVFVENSARRCGLRKRVKEPTREIERLSHRWEQAERDYGPADLRRGWLVFLDFLPTDSDIEHPQAYFLGSLARWISEAPQSPPTRINPQSEREPAIEAEPLFEDLYRDHPKKSFRVLAQQALVVVLTSAVNPQETAARIRKSHAEWVPTWGHNDGKYAPRLDRWLTDSGWMDDAPPVNGRPHIDYSDPKRYELGD